MDESNRLPAGREHILRAALDLIGRDGVAQLTNRSVARAAQVSLGSLTYHFPSQQELLREALELFLTEELARLTGVNEKLEAGAWDSEQAAAAFEALLEADRDRRMTKLELYLRAAREPALRVAATDCFLAYDALARSALNAAGIHANDEAATLVVAVIDGLQLRRLATGATELNLAGPLREMLAALEAAKQPASD